MARNGPDRTAGRYGEKQLHDRQHNNNRGFDQRSCAGVR